MTGGEILRGNHLISEFMGVTWKEDLRNGSYYVGDVPEPFPANLRYCTSWDWLIPVIRKADKLTLEDNILVNNSVMTYVNALSKIKRARRAPQWAKR